MKMYRLFPKDKGWFLLIYLSLPISKQNKTKRTWTQEHPEANLALRLSLTWMTLVLNLTDT